MTSPQPPRQTATYTSPQSQAFALTSSDLPSISSSSQSQSITEKQSYLSALRASSQKMQDDINAELTRRMDEDNARAAADAVGPTTKKEGNKKEEDAEEENYGEEVVEEDE